MAEPLPVTPPLPISEPVSGTRASGRTWWRRPMSGRDPAEHHRGATPLELLFDLCFVVAVAQVGAALHHDIVEGNVGHALWTYLFLFFGIWWAWVNFTWFASAYDVDDIPYRLLTFVQIAGVLVLAAGVPPAFEDFDFRIGVAGYVIMRLALVAQWLRAAGDDPVGRPVAVRYAVAVAALQVLWIVRLAIPGPAGVALFVVFGVMELLAPAWAESAGRQTPWHPAHIAERYGLFTIIVLGESILAASTAAQAAITDHGISIELVTLGIGGLVLVLAMWWAYFKSPATIDHALPLRWQLAWGYGHYVVFAAIAAVGVGLQVAIDAMTPGSAVSAGAAGLAVAIPASCFLVAGAALHHGREVARRAPEVAVAVVALLAFGLAAGALGAPLAVLGMGLVLAALVGWAVVRNAQRVAAG